MAQTPDLLVFPKFFFPHLSVEELAKTVLDCGFDGTDVMIRETSWCKEEDYVKTLPAFAEKMRGIGLKCYTATTSWTHERLATIEDDYRLFADNGIRQFRFLAQTYRGHGTFREDFALCRRSAERLESLGQKHGVMALFQNHGGALFWSPATAYFLLKSLDPKAVGVHYDPGNMWHQEGQTNPTLSVDALGEFLAYVGVKNCGWFLVPDHENDQRLSWQRQWTRLDLGLVNWDEVLRALHTAGFNGPLCMHNFYKSTLEGLIEGTKHDVEFLRSLMSRIWA